MGGHPGPRCFVAAQVRLRRSARQNLPLHLRNRERFFLAGLLQITSPGADGFGLLRDSSEAANAAPAPPPPARAEPTDGSHAAPRAGGDRLAQERQNTAGLGRPSRAKPKARWLERGPGGPGDKQGTWRKAGSRQVPRRLFLRGHLLIKTQAGRTDSGPDLATPLHIKGAAEQTLLGQGSTVVQYERRRTGQ